MNGQPYAPDEWAEMFRRVRRLIDEEMISSLLQAGDNLSDAYWTIAYNAWKLIEIAECEGVRERGVIDAVIGELVTKSSSSVRHYRGVLLWYAERIAEEEFPGVVVHYSFYLRVRQEYPNVRFAHFRFAMNYSQYWRQILQYGEDYLEQFGKLPTVSILEEYFQNEIFSANLARIEDAPAIEAPFDDSYPWAEPDPMTGEMFYNPEVSGWTEKAFIEHFHKPLQYIAEQIEELPITVVTKNRIMGNLRELSEAIELARHEALISRFRGGALD